MRRLLPVVLVSLLLAACGTSQPPGSEPPPNQEPDPSPEPDSATVRLTIPPEHLPLVQLVAFQNGEGSWTELEKGAGPYELEVTDSSGRYGVALVCLHSPPGDEEGNDSRPYLEPIILQTTVAEFSSLTLPCIEALYGYDDRSGSGDLTGEVSNFEPLNGELLYFSAGPRDIGVSPSANPSFSLADLADGVFDLIVSLRPDDQAITRLAVKHDVEVSNGAAHVEVDWDTSHAVETFQLTVNGTRPDDEMWVFSSLETKNGTWAYFGDAEAGTPGSEYRTQYRAAPVEVLQQGDLQSLYLSAEDSSGQIRTVQRFFTAGQDLEVDLPKGYLNLTATPVAGPYPRFALAWDEVGATLNSSYISYHTDELQTGWDVLITRGWLTANSYTLPDLSDLDSWNPTWNASDPEIDFTYNWFNTFFEPLDAAMDHHINWYERQEGEYRSLGMSFGQD